MKKNYHVIMNQDVHRSIKVIAARRGLTIGGTIEALVNFSEAARYLKDPDQRERFKDMLTKEYIEAGLNGGFTFEGESD